MPEQKQTETQVPDGTLSQEDLESVSGGARGGILPAVGPIDQHVIVIDPAHHLPPESIG